MNQNEILSTLSKEEQSLLHAVLNLEQTKLNVISLKNNSSEEKEIIIAIYKLVENKIKNEA